MSLSRTPSPPAFVPIEDEPLLLGPLVSPDQFDPIPLPLALPAPAEPEYVAPIDQDVATLSQLVHDLNLPPAEPVLPLPQHAYIDPYLGRVNTFTPGPLRDPEILDNAGFDHTFDYPPDQPISPHQVEFEPATQLVWPDVSYPTFFE